LVRVEARRGTRQPYARRPTTTHPRALAAWTFLFAALVTNVADVYAADSPAGRPAATTILSHIDIPSAAFYAAVEHGDTAEAVRLLSAHFASRPRLVYANELFGLGADNPRNEAAYVRDKPDLVMQNRFAFLFDYVATGHDFDWNGRFDRGDREITWWINRFFYLICLTDEYDRTNRAEYPRHGVELILDWIRKNPVEKAAESWGSWRTLEIGLRLVEWSRFVDRFAAERIIRPDELVTMLASLREQTEYLIAHSGPRRGNWGFMEQCGIGTVALVFPEFKDANRWLTSVLDNYATDTAYQIYADGSQEEMTTHYHAVVVHTLARLLDLARQRKHPVPPRLTDTLKRAATYAVVTLKPDLTLPMLNDGDAIDLTPLFGCLARTLDLPEAKHVLSRGREGPAPPLCRMFPNSGLAIFRDSWKPDARCLIFDAGPFGTGHQHEDALQFDVSAFGRSFIVDPGRYTYVEGPWRDYFVGTRAHSTIMIDGGQQVRRKHPELWRGEKPIADQFVAGDDLALAVGDYKAGYSVPTAEGVTHRREILFVHREYWVISDVLLGSGRHRVEQNFQYTPGKLRVAENMAVTGHPDANLAMLWLWPTAPQVQVREGRKDPPIGWYSNSYGRLAAAPHLTLGAELDLPARITLVLYPFKGPKPPDVTARAMTLDGTGPARAGAIEFRIAGRSALVLTADPRAPVQPEKIGDFTIHCAPAAAVVVCDGRTTTLTPEPLR